jgi:hypothetical protein
MTHLKGRPYVLYVYEQGAHENTSVKKEGSNRELKQTAE